jgi:hypothetical protein
MLLAVLVTGVGLASEQEKKPETFSLTNKAKDIQVVSDRDEAIVAFFRRQHLLVAGLEWREIQRAQEARQAREKVFVSYASYNDDPEKTALFGATIKLAPIPETVARVLAPHKKGPDGKENFQLTVVLRRDEKDAELYHVVGCTDRSSVGFFTVDKARAPDDFSQKDLMYRPEPKK